MRNLHHSPGNEGGIPSRTLATALYPPVLEVKIKIEIKLPPRIRAGIGPKPSISSEKWQPGPFPGPPGGRGDKSKVKSALKYNWVYFVGH